MQVLFRHGIVGMKTHRLEYEAIRYQPPWNHLQLIESSWKGMRGEVDQMLAIVEELSNRPKAELPYTHRQLQNMARSCPLYPDNILLSCFSTLQR